MDITLTIADEDFPKAVEAFASKFGYQPETFQRVEKTDANGLTFTDNERMPNPQSKEDFFKETLAASIDNAISENEVQAAIIVARETAANKPKGKATKVK